MGYKWWNQLKDIMPVMVVSMGAMVVSYFAISFFNFGLYLDGILKALLYIAIYAGWTFIFKPEASTNIKTVLVPILKKTKKQNSKEL